MGKDIKLLPPFKIGFRTLSLSERKNYGIDLHNIPQAWKNTQGEGIKVAVIDTGLPVHRDLDNQITESENFTNDPIEDLVVGHSTHVSGIIAAEENDEGVVGIAPKSKLIIAKALGDSGGGTDSGLAKAIDWCVDQGAQVINMSLGAPAEYGYAFLMTKAAVKRAYEQNIVVVCASGNESADKVGVPARWDECIAVGAVNNKQQKADFSNKGETLDFAASGVDIVSTFTNNSYASLSGTSMSCPQIAGIVALLLSEHRGDQTGKRTPINNVKDVIEHLKKICIDLGPDGFDKEYGFGLPVYGSTNDEDPIVDPPKPDPKPKPQPKPKKWWQRIFDYIKKIEYITNKLRK